MPHQLGQLGPLVQALDQRAPAQVEVAVAQAGLLADLGVPLDREGQHVGRGEHLDGVDRHLDRAGRQLGVDRLGRSGHDLARHRHHALEPQVAQGLEGRQPGMGDELDHAGVVRPGRIAEIDEEQAPVVALGRHPPGQAHRAAHVGGPQDPAPGVPVLIDGQGSRGEQRRDPYDSGG